MPAARRAPSAPKAASGAQEVAPGIFLGGSKDAAAFDGRRFCVLDEAPDGLPESTHIPIYDETRDAPIVPNLDRLADDVHRARGAGEPVLIFCGHGVRRSPLATAWYLHRYEQLSLAAAYDRIRAVRPKIETADEWIGHAELLDG
jgi:protein-tyrosine phosphatase